MQLVSDVYRHYAKTVLSVIFMIYTVLWMVTCVLFIIRLETAAFDSTICDDTEEIVVARAQLRAIRDDDDLAHFKAVQRVQTLTQPAPIIDANGHTASSN